MLSIKVGVYATENVNQTSSQMAIMGVYSR